MALPFLFFFCSGFLFFLIGFGDFQRESDAAVDAVAAA